MATTCMTQVSSDTQRIQRYLSLYTRLRNKQKNRHWQIKGPGEEPYTLPKLLYFWRSHLRLRSRKDTVEPAVPIPEQEPSIYRPLGEGEIRLIRILPGNWNTPLQCELEHVAAGDQVKYVALSYAWGGSNDHEWMKLNGRDHRIKTSLAAALRRLRDYLSRVNKGADTMIRVDTQSFRVWADALCLNQNDIDEKQHQVPRMGTIFSRAEDVYIWLEENPSDSDYAIQRTLDAANAIHASMDKRAAQEKFAEIHGNDLSVIERGFNSLFRRRWFGRVWVIQEVALAKRAPIIIAGYAWTDADSLLRLFRTVNPRPMAKIGLHHIMFLILMAQRQRYAKKMGTREMMHPDPQVMAAHLRSALENIGFFNASISHDYLYAILGLCTAGDLPAALAPSYKTPFEEVCRNYTKFIIEANGNLSILTASRRCSASVPSWVPDFTSIVDIGPSSFPAFVKFSECGRKLKVLGRQIGRCVKVHMPTEYPPWMERQPNEKNPSQGPYHKFRKFQDYLQSAADRHNLPLMEYIERWLLLTTKNILRGGVIDSALVHESQRLLLQTYDENTDAFKDTTTALQLAEAHLAGKYCSQDEVAPDLHSDQAYRQGLLDALAKAMDEEQPWPKEIQTVFDQELTTFSSVLTANGTCAIVLRLDNTPEIGDVVVCGVEEDAGKAMNAALLRHTGTTNEYSFVGMVQSQPWHFLETYVKNIIETAVPEELVIV